MSVFLQDADVTLLHGDVLDVLRELPSESVDCVVTSPPYWGLRDYGTGQWEGGDEACDHLGPSKASESSGLKNDGRPAERVGQNEYERAATVPYRDVCGRCGARRVDQQLGLEPTPDEYVRRLVAVFREVRRVLAPHGTCWVNLGDSYTSGGRADYGPSKPDKNIVLHNAARAPHPPELKPKDLVGIPWRVAFALQQDGWLLRSDIIWSKLNPMPESVTDRPTKAHEMVFLLTKCRWVGAIEPTPMSPTDAAWLAALVDGEGSICFQERANKEWAPTVSPRISICNTNRDLLERAAEITGLAVNGAASPRLRGDGSVGRPMWTWQITDRKAARIITAIRPYLIAKRSQADLALAVYALNAKTKGRGRVGRTTDSALAFKRRAAAACSDLNRGREVDLSWFTPPRDGRWVPNAYHFDQEAVREKYLADHTWDAFRGGHSEPSPYVEQNGPQPNSARGPDGRRVTRVLGQDGSEQHRDGERWPNPSGRNVRSVWTIATQPYPEAHFATYPEELVRRCVLAGTSEKGKCPECGAPWVRDVERELHPAQKHFTHTAPRDGYNKNFGEGYLPARQTITTLAWIPGCACFAPDGDDQCPYEPISCVVLDPFVGSGTTCLVARNHGRHSVGIDLSADYLELAAKRLSQQSLFSEPALPPSSGDM